MNRFLLYYMGKGLKPSMDLEKVRSMPGVVVVNDTLPRGVVLDVYNDLSAERLRRLVGWDLQVSQPVSVDIEPAISSSQRKIPGLRLV